MTKDISRRRVLALSGAVLGGGVGADTAGARQERAETEIRGWIMRGERSEVDERVGVVEEFRHRGMNLCNDGKVYRCRTCDDVEFYLLVTRDASEPTAGDAYRFESTGEESRCGNFQVRLLEATGCEDEAVRGGPTDSRNGTVDGDSEVLSVDGAETTPDGEPDRGARGGPDGVDAPSRTTGSETQTETATTATESTTTTATETAPGTPTSARQPSAEPDAETTSEPSDGE